MLDLAIIEEGQEDDMRLGLEWLLSQEWFELYSPEFNWTGDSIDRSWKLNLDADGAQEYYKYGFHRIKQFRTENSWEGDGGIMVYFNQRIFPNSLGDGRFHDCLHPEPMLEDIPCPDHEQYMEHQVSAIQELDKRETGCLLADEMGLGKTVTALGLVNLRGYRKVLVVCPASVKGMWHEHAERWIAHPVKVATLNAGDVEGFLSYEDGIYITGYETVRLAEAKSIRETEWDMIILDESERIKNPKATTTLNICGGWDDEGNEYKPIKAKYKLLLSGTAMPNRTTELWTSLNYIYPDFFMDSLKDKFKSTFGGRGRRSYGRNTDGLRKWFEAGAIRRKKSIVMSEMPPKQRHTELLTLSAEALSKLHEVENEAIAHSFALGGLGELKIGLANWSRVWVQTARAKALPNAEYLWKFLDENPDEQVVFFRHHDITRDAIQLALRTRGIQCLNFDGSMSTERKDEAVRLFQQENSPYRCIVVSITSGGRGITLTRARHAMFGEINCVPSNLIQCEDRLHRIGQHRPVEVTYLYAFGSIEANMGSILAAKIPTIDAVVEGERVQDDIVEVDTDMESILQEIGQTGIKGYHRFWRIKQILIHKQYSDGERQGQRMYGSAYLEFQYTIERMKNHKTGEKFKIIRPSRR